MGCACGGGLQADPDSQYNMGPGSEERQEGEMQAGTRSGRGKLCCDVSLHVKHAFGQCEGLFFMSTKESSKLLEGGSQLCK